MQFRIWQKRLLFGFVLLAGLFFFAWELIQLSATARIGYLHVENRLGAYDSLVRSLSDDQVAGEAANMLSEREGAAVPALVRGLESPDNRTRVACTIVLGRIGPPALAAVPSIMERLKSGEETGRMSAAKSICRIGRYDPGVKAELLDLLETGDESARYCIAETISEIGMPAEMAVPALIRRLGDKCDRIRMEVAEALGNYGAEAKSAVPALITTLKDSNRKVRSEAKEALEKILEGLPNEDPKWIEAVKRAMEAAEKAN